MKVGLHLQNSTRLMHVLYEGEGFKNNTREVQSLRLPSSLPFSPSDEEDLSQRRAYAQCLHNSSQLLPKAEEW